MRGQSFTIHPQLPTAEDCSKDRSESGLSKGFLSLNLQKFSKVPKKNVLKKVQKLQGQIGVWTFKRVSQPQLAKLFGTHKNILSGGQGCENHRFHEMYVVFNSADIMNGVSILRMRGLFRVLATLLHCYITTLQHCSATPPSV